MWISAFESQGTYNLPEHRYSPSISAGLEKGYGIFTSENLLETNCKRL